MPKHRKLLKLLFVKIPFFVAILLLVMIAALKMVERYPDPLKEGFEKYLSEQTNTNATIEDVEKITFFPNIDIRLKKLTMHRKENAAIIDMEAEKIFMSAPLSGFFINKGRLNFIDIKNLKATAGVVTQHPIELYSVKIIDKKGPEQFGHFLIAKGLYGGQKMTIEAQINKDEKSYIIPQDLSFSLTLGDYSLNGKTKKDFYSLKLVDAIFQKNNQRSEAKTYILTDKRETKDHKGNNPLFCLYHHAGDDLKQCNIFLK